MMQLLIVDDELELLEILTYILESQGHRVKVAGDVTKALEYYQQDFFDLVISDYKMPGKNGLDLLAAIEVINAETKRQSYFILCTGGLGEELTEADVMSKGVHGFLAKPYIREQIIELVNKFEGMLSAHPQ